jgi:hypothetical protein
MLTECKETTSETFQNYKPLGLKTKYDLKRDFWMNETGMGQEVAMIPWLLDYDDDDDDDADGGGGGEEPVAKKEEVRRV